MSRDREIPSPRTLTGLFSTSRRIEQNAVSDEWRPLPPRPALECFRFRGQQHHRETNDTSPSAASTAATASSSSTRRREKWDGRIQLRASSQRQKIDRERAQRQSTAASDSTRQLRDVATGRAKLLSLQARLEQECREEMEREAEEKMQVEVVEHNDGGYLGDVVGFQGRHLPRRNASTRKKAEAGGDSSGMKTTTTCTHRHQKEEDVLVCLPNDNVPYLQFITKKTKRENEDDASKEEQQGNEKYKTSPSSPVSLNNNGDNDVDSPPGRTVTAEKGGDAPNATSSPSTADELATKVKELEERLERLGNHTGNHHCDNISESDRSESKSNISEPIGVSKGETYKSGANDTSGIGNISKGGDAEDLLGSFESKFGDDDDACKDSSPPPSVSRPRPPVLLVPHTNDAIHVHPSLTSSCSSVATTGILRSAQEAEQSIVFEGFVLGSLIDSIP